MPGGGIPGVGGEWFFSSSKTSSRECPAWGSNKNIEMVVPGAAKPLQPQPPRGSKRWFASFSEADTSQLQGSEVESADEQGRLEVLEVANPVGESAQQKEGEGAPTKAEGPVRGSDLRDHQDAGVLLLFIVDTGLWGAFCLWTSDLRVIM
jgi:hypothetical protein